MTGVRYIPTENLEALREATPVFLRSFVNDLVVVGKVSLLSHSLRDSQVFLSPFSNHFKILSAIFHFSSFLQKKKKKKKKKQNNQGDSFSLGSYFLEALKREPSNNSVFISNLSVSVELKVREFLHKASLVLLSLSFSFIFVIIIIIIIFIIISKISLNFFQLLIFFFRGMKKPCHFLGALKKEG